MTAPLPVEKAVQEIDPVKGRSYIRLAPMFFECRFCGGELPLPRHPRVQYCSRYCKKAQDSSDSWRRLKMKVLELLGAKCVVCGISDPRVLAVNHLNGDGAQERRVSHARDLYRRIVRGERETSDLEIRCANCNHIYEYERGRLRW